MASSVVVARAWAVNVGRERHPDRRGEGEVRLPSGSGVAAKDGYRADARETKVSLEVGPGVRIRVDIERRSLEVKPAPRAETAGRTYTCGNCRREGHNVRTCTAPTVFNA